MNFVHIINGELKIAKENNNKIIADYLEHLLSKYNLLTTKQKKVVSAAEDRAGKTLETRKGDKVECISLVDKHKKEGYIYEFKCVDCSTSYNCSFQAMRAGRIRCGACAFKYRSEKISKANKKYREENKETKKEKPLACKNGVLLHKHTEEELKKAWRQYTPAEYEALLKEIKRKTR